MARLPRAGRTILIAAAVLLILAVLARTWELVGALAILAGVVVLVFAGLRRLPAGAASTPTIVAPQEHLLEADQAVSPDAVTGAVSPSLVPAPLSVPAPLEPLSAPAPAPDTAPPPPPTPAPAAADPLAATATMPIAERQAPVAAHTDAAPEEAGSSAPDAAGGDTAEPSRAGDD
jgi:hypothetical protein